MNRVLLVLGSNIEPAKNILCAINHLRNQPSIKIIKYSSVWQTKSVGIDAADFFNLAIQAETDLSSTKLKDQVIGYIESELKRVRTMDKFAPRTIDIDIVIFNDSTLDENIFRYEYLVFPLAELIPDFHQPGEPTLENLATLMKPRSSAIRLEGLLENNANWPC
jgi:2-amino-4-hydroxy-6-hydroxymethyldihydropteridine diphosphokinase